MQFCRHQQLINCVRGSLLECLLCTRQVGFRYPVESYQRLEKWYMLFPCLAFSTSGKNMGVNHTVLPGDQPQTVAFTLLAQLCGQKAKESEMGAALFTKNGEGRTLTFFIILYLIFVAFGYFQRFLTQTGGHQGGWDEYDHQTFLKLKKKHKVIHEIRKLIADYGSLYKNGYNI